MVVLLLLQIVILERIFDELLEQDKKQKLCQVSKSWIRNMRGIKNFLLNASSFKTSRTFKSTNSKHWNNNCQIPFVLQPFGTLAPTHTHALAHSLSGFSHWRALLGWHQSTYKFAEQLFSTPIQPFSANLFQLEKI